VGKLKGCVGMGEGGGKGAGVGDRWGWRGVEGGWALMLGRREEGRGGGVWARAGRGRRLNEGGGGGGRGGEVVGREGGGVGSSGKWVGEKRVGTGWKRPWGSRGGEKGERTREHEMRRGREEGGGSVEGEGGGDCGRIVGGERVNEWGGGEGGGDGGGGRVG